MKVEELRNRTIEELNKMANENKTKISQIRFDVKARQANDHRDIRSIKREIARISTVIKEKKKGEDNK